MKELKDILSTRTKWEPINSRVKSFTPALAKDVISLIGFKLNEVTLQKGGKVAEPVFLLSNKHLDKFNDLVKALQDHKEELKTIGINEYTITIYQNFVSNDYEFSPVNYFE